MKVKIQNDITSRHLPHLEVTSIFPPRSPGIFFLGYLNVLDDIEANVGVKIPVSRSDMSFQSQTEKIIVWRGTKTGRTLPGVAVAAAAATASAIRVAVFGRIIAVVVLLLLRSGEKIEHLGRHPRDL